MAIPHLSGIMLIDGSASAPALAFNSDTNTGIYRSADDRINISVGGTNMFHVNSAGITSAVNVYSGTNGQFRNYSGVWKGSTGVSGNGFQFTSADGTAMTLSSTGDVSFAGYVHSEGRVRIQGGTDNGSQLNLFCDSSGDAHLSAYTFSINTGNNNTRTQSLKIDHNKKATFAGDVIINRSSVLGTAKLSIQADAGEDVFGVQCNSNNTTTKLINIFNSSGTDIASITINNDSTPDMLFNVDDGSGNITEVLKLDSSQNATFAGTLGIAGSSPVSTSALTIKSQSTSSQQSAIDIIQNGGTNAIIRMGEKSDDGGRFHMFDGGTEKIAFYTDGTNNHISAGNLAIGSNSADGKLDITQSSATDPVLRLTDDGVANYDFIFPDTSTIKLETNTSSTKTFKLLNAGSGDFNFEASSATFAGEATFGGNVTIDSSGSTDNYYLTMNESGSNRFTIYENSNNVYFNGWAGHTIFRPRMAGSGSFAVLQGNTQFDTSGNATFAGDVTVNGSHLKLLNHSGAYEGVSTDYLYIGGSGLDGSDAAIYLGNAGNDTGYGWRFYYEGSGSGNDNKLIIKSENAGSGVDALAFTQDGNATFAGTIGSGNINISDGTPVLTLTDTSSSATVTHTLDGVNYQIANNGSSGNFKLSRKVSTTERVFLHAHDNGNLYFYGTGSLAQTISGADTTFAGETTFNNDITLNVAKVLKSSHNPASNFLDFDDDSTTHNPDSNVTTLGSVSGIALATNLNDGGGGHFTVSTGSTGTRLFTILKTGNVGVGIENPIATLHLNSSTTETLMQITNSTTGGAISDGLRFGCVGNNVTFINRENGTMSFSTNNTERIRITSGGDTTFAGATYTDGTVRSRKNIVSNSTYNVISLNSSRTVDDYGGLNKDYMKIDLVTPGANTDGNASAHGFGSFSLKLANNAGSTAMGEVLNITAGGNTTFAGDVGINVTPAFKLHVKDDQDSTFNNGIAIERSNTTQRGYLNMQGGAFNIVSYDNVSTKFRVGSNGVTTALELTNAGNATFAGNITAAFDSNNSGNRLRIADTEGTSAAVRTYSTSDGTGLILNHYYAVSGSPYMRYSDFVSNMGDAAATTMRFLTKPHNGNPTVALTIDNSQKATFANDIYSNGNIIFGGDDTYNATINYVDNTGGDHYLLFQTQHNGTTDDTLKLHANTKLATFSGDVDAGSYKVSGTTRIDSNGKFFPASINGTGKISFLNGSSAQGARVSSLYAGTTYANDGSAAGYVDVLNGYRVQGTTVVDSNRNFIGNGNLFLRSYNDSGEGIFFRNGFEHGDSNPYNLSITIFNDGDGSADALEINAYDGIYFNTGSGTQNIRAKIDGAGVATFYNDVTVNGNLTVGGTTTTLNTQTVEVEDNILQLNTTQGTPDTATATTSGISVYRGNGVTQASFIFDDADDTWDLTNNLNVAGQLTSGRILATASGTGIHQLVNASVNSTVLQLITTGDDPDLALSFQTDHIFNTGASLHIQNDNQKIFLRGSQTTVGTTTAQSGYELTVSDGPGKSIHTSGTITTLGGVEFNTGLIKYEQNTDVDSAAAEAVASVVKATHTAAFFDYVIKKGTNVRAGVVAACHDGTNVEYAETSTVDLGDTSDVTLSVDISGTLMRLIATTTSNDWSVKSLIRAI